MSIEHGKVGKVGTHGNVGTGEAQILNVGRRTRTIPPALRRALEFRDRGCRFPDHSPAASGARGLRFADAHHVRHWADGGETSLGNCLLLCWHHHRLVHEGKWTVQWWGEGRPVFLDPRGGTHFDGRWRPPESSDESSDAPSDAPSDGPSHAPASTPAEVSAAALVRDHHARGIRPDGWTASAEWKREKDIPDSILFRAMEALS